MSTQVTHTVKVQPGTKSWVDEAGQAILGRHGFSYSQTGPQEYAITGPAEPHRLRDALVELDVKDFRFLRDAFLNASEPVIKILNDVNAIKRLEFRCHSDKPSFPFANLAGLPFSYPFDQQIQKRFKDLLGFLESLGVTAKLGAEMEFVLSASPIPGHENAIGKLAYDLAMHEERLALSAPVSGKQEHIERMLAMRHFNARDFLMMHLLEKDPVTQAVFLHSFGKEGGGNGYYDNENVLETRTKIIAADRFFETYLPAQRHMLSKVFEYRFQIKRKVISQQLSASLWRGGRNILLCETPEDEATTQRMAQALGYMLQDGYKLFFPIINNPAHSKFPVVSPSRLSLVRHAYGRFEIKGFDSEAQHLALGALMFAGAAGIALSPDYNGWKLHACETRRVIVPGVKFLGNKLPWLRHAITASHVDEQTGRLMPDAGYISMAATKILQQIDPEFKWEESREKVNGLPVCSSEHCSAVFNLISAARMIQDENQWRMEWPEDKTFIIAPERGVSGKTMNSLVTGLGVSSRFIYQPPEEATSPSFESNVLLPHVFGTDLFNALARAYKQEVAENNLTGEDLLDFVKRVDAAFRHGVEDSGQGFGVLRVPVSQSTQTSAATNVKKMLDVLREDRGISSFAFDALHFVAADLGRKGDKSVECVFHIPTSLIEQTAKIIAAGIEEIGGLQRQDMAPSIP